MDNFNNGYNNGYDNGNNGYNNGNNGYNNGNNGYNNGNNANNNSGYFESPVNNGGYNQNNFEANQQFMQGNNPMDNGAKEYVLWLVLGIIQALSICCCNWVAVITGTITIIFAIQANSQRLMGNYYAFKKKIGVAKVVNLIGWGLMVVSIVLNLVFGLTDFIKSLFSSISA